VRKVERTLLTEHLDAFVWIEIAELKRQGGATTWHIEEVQRRMKALRETPSGHESLMFRLPHTAKAVGVLVECLAVLAFVPGGVNFGDLHFEASCDDAERDEEGKDEMSI
jgi:hypothetical protein